MERNALVFDLDGTLVDSIGGITAALGKALAAFGGAPLAAEEVRELVGDGSAVLVRRALGRVGLPESAAEPALARFLDAYRQAPLRATRLYDGVAETLGLLAADGWRMAVCTNKTTAIAAEVLAGLGIAHRFAAIVGGDTLPFRKPDPRHVGAALAALGAAPRAAVMVGDNEHDAAAGRAAGTAVVIVRWGYARVAPERLGADALLDDFARLPEVLAGLPRG